MGLTNSSEFQTIGMPGMGYGGLGGFGGGGLLEGIILASLLRGRGGLMGDGSNGDLDADGIAAKVVQLQSTANISGEVQTLGNEIANSFAIQNLATQAQFNQTNTNIAQAASAASLASKDAQIDALRTANALQTNIEALSTKTDAQYAATLTAIANDGQATRALITQAEIAGLRDQLFAERRRADAREVEISINNSNQQTQNQLQSQTGVLGTILSGLGDQIAKNTNSVVAVGSTLLGTAQSANPVNIK